MPSIDDMLVEIDATTERLRRELKKGDRRIMTFERQTNRRLKKVDAHFDRLGLSAVRLVRQFGLLGGVGLISSIAGLSQLTDEAMQSADALQTVADKLGLTTTALQEYRFAAEESGVATQTFDMAMQRFTRRLGEAQAGSGELKPILDQYNIAIRDAEGRTRSAEEVLRDYADAVRDAVSPQEQLRLAFKGFDSEGAALVTLLRQGAEGLDQYAARAHELGVVLDEDVVRRLAASKRELEIFNAQLKANSAVIADNLRGVRTWGSEFGVWITGKIKDGIAALQRFQRQAEIDYTKHFGHLPPHLQGGAGQRSNVDAKRDREDIVGGIEAADKALGQWVVTVDTSDQAWRKHQETLKKTGEIGEAVASNMAGAFDEFLEGGKIGFEEFANAALKDIARVLFRQAILAPITGGIQTGLGNAIPFGGFRQAGGDVSPGKMYMVGERGPEPFIPRVAGKVLPSGSGAGGAIQVNIINRSSTQVEGTAQQRTSSGGRQIDVVLGDMVASQVRRPGSSTQQALAAAGGRSPLVQR